MACDTPFYVNRSKFDDTKVPVPCGRCPNCKRRRVNSWVVRLLSEEQRHGAAHFVTLTYDTDHVPISPNGYKTLDKTDVQKFFKRLRKLLPKDHTIRYYAVGEYGSKTQRPHYHAIIFGVPDVDMFGTAWSLGGIPIGGIYVGQVSSDSIAYTLKYIDKAGLEKRHGRDDRAKEFSLMSKGMGDNYITPAIQEYYQADISRLYVTRPGGYRVALPRYYRHKLFTKQQMSAQVDIIADAVYQSKAQQLAEYLTANPGHTEMDFYLEEQSAVLGRIKRFQNRALKERTTI